MSGPNGKQFFILFLSVLFLLLTKYIQVMFYDLCDSTAAASQQPCHEPTTPTTTPTTLAATSWLEGGWDKRNGKPMTMKMCQGTNQKQEWVGFDR